MKRIVAILAAAAVAALASASTAARPPVASGPGLVVSHDGRIYVEARPIARGWQPAWTPDGRRIAFTRAGEIYVVGGDGRNERRLTTMAQPGAFPAWSPDGRTIAFARLRDVYTVPFRGGAVRRLTRSAEPWRMRTTPSYSPDGPDDRDHGHDRRLQQRRLRHARGRLGPAPADPLTGHARSLRRRARAGVLARRQAHRLRLESERAPPRTGVS